MIMDKQVAQHKHPATVESAHESMTFGHDEPTLSPYTPGEHISLQILENHHDPPLPSSLSAVVESVFTMTMSPVLRVTLTSATDSYGPAVLKLYDRRFGTGLRKSNRKHCPLTPTHEAAFLSFLQKAKMEPFLRELKEESKKDMFPAQPDEFLDGTPEGLARYEAALWQEAENYFSCETEAYNRLVDIQGEAIPCMHATVRVVFTQAESTSLVEPCMVPYLEVKGILLQLIPGYDLWELPTSPSAPSDPAAWPPIVQAAVNAVHAINQRGVVLKDCDPRNVVVHQHSHKPFIVDLAQCSFKDKLLQLWRDMGYADPGTSDDDDDDEEWDPEEEWIERLRQKDNVGAVGVLMRKRIRDETGMKLEIHYPR